MIICLWFVDEKTTNATAGNGFLQLGSEGALAAIGGEWFRVPKEDITQVTIYVKRRLDAYESVPRDDDDV